MSENIAGSAEEQFEQESLVYRMRALYPKTFDYLLYFYEGQLPVTGDVIEVPADKRHWAQRAYTLGFRLDANGDPINYAEMLAWFNHPVAADDESGETAEETNDESADGGRQPVSDDGVRQSTEAGADSLPSEGLDSGDGDGSADGSDGDDAAGEAVRPDEGRQPRPAPRKRRGR